jgi:hypothetical protein
VVVAASIAAAGGRLRIRTRRVGQKCLRWKRGAAAAAVVGGRSSRHPGHRAPPPPLCSRPRQRAVRVPPLARRRARPGPARAAARSGAPKVQVLVLDL